MERVIQEINDFIECCKREFLEKEPEERKRILSLNENDFYEDSYFEIGLYVDDFIIPLIADIVQNSLIKEFSNKE